MNLSDISKLSPAQQRAVMADQVRASAARERIMAQYQGQGQPKRTTPYGPNGEELHGQASSSVPARGAPKGPKVSETHIQQDVVRWWRDNCYEWQLEEEFLMAIPNAGKRSPRNGSRMVAEGLRAGAPDLFAAVPRGDCGGLFIELKTRDGVLSESQRLMLARLTKIGYATLVARSADEAIAAIRCYLNLPTPSK